MGMAPLFLNLEALSWLMSWNSMPKANCDLRKCGKSWPISSVGLLPPPCSVHLFIFYKYFNLKLLSFSSPLLV